MSFEDVADGRFAIIGGRQSAYEWAALLCDHGAAKVDVVHRHETPAFEKVSWKFVDPLVEHTLATAAGGATCRRPISRPSRCSSGRSAG